MKLSAKEFDVTLLEKVMLGGEVSNLVIVGKNKNKQFTKSTLSVNASGSKLAEITQRLSGNSEFFELALVSNILNNLTTNEERRNYIYSLHNLARTVLSPLVRCEDGTRAVFLDAYKKDIENITKNN